MSDFKAKEIQIIDEVMARLKDERAVDLSKQTHDKLWDSVNIGEIMPIEAVFWNDIESANEEDIKWAKAVLKPKRHLYAR
ncbi:hypothetical protein CUPS3778_09695, partial [Campylobacter upsaliensis]|nr:hypothetical protein [Campylobacter upsaliensis]